MIGSYDGSHSRLPGSLDYLAQTGIHRFDSLQNSAFIFNMADYVNIGEVGYYQLLLFCLDKKTVAFHS